MAFKNTCTLCGNEEAKITQFSIENHVFCCCPICGNYILPTSSLYLIKKELESDAIKKYDVRKLVAFLLHNKVEERYAFIGTNESYEKYKRLKPNTQSFLVTTDTVENWYPKTFEERVNHILLYIANYSQFIGEAIRITTEIAPPLFFLANKLDGGEKSEQEVGFVFRYLVEQKLVEEMIDRTETSLFAAGYGPMHLTLSAKAWSLVYDLQKNKANNKDVFVAMKFGDATRELREKIREGIISAGYEPRIMDEIEHNHQIVPEMLHEIKQCRFVIAELSNHNNGAYYEAGFALGLDKEVIHICSEQEIKSGLHFDVAQINTITYQDIAEIPNKLKKRIEATIK